MALGERSLLLEVVVAGGAGAVSKTLTAPLEVAKLSQQLRPEYRNTGLFATWYDLVAKEGFLALFKGNIANVLVYFPCRVSTFFSKRPFATCSSLQKALQAGRKYLGMSPQAAWQALLVC